MRNAFKIFAALGLLLFLAAPSGAAGERVIAQLQARGTSSLSKKLKFFLSNLEVIGNHAVVLSGTFTQPGSSLVFGTTTVPTAPDGRFDYLLQLSSERTVFEATAVSPNGQIEKQTYVVVIPQQAGANPGNAKAAAAPQIHFFNAALGFTTSEYTQTKKDSYEALALCGKISYRYLIAPPLWDLAANSFMTLLPLSSNRSDAVARFFGANIRIGYIFPQIRPPWGLSLMGGLYFTTMFVTTDRARDLFGFQNLMGPQLFPVIRHALGNGDQLMTYFKLSPIADSFALLTLSNREIATGIGWSRPLPNRKSWGLNIDYANIKLDVAGAEATSSSLSLTGGYNW